MTRIAIVCACDTFSADTQLGPLPGTRLDGTRMFSLLSDPEFGGYDTAASQYLRNPTRANILDAFLQTSEYTDVSTFTIYFATHGFLENGQFFICLSDTRTAKLSLSALSASSLFEFIRDIGARHTNLVLDTCHSGGLGTGLSTLLSASSLGDAGSLSISIFGAAMRDQSASETANGGIATQALCDVLEQAPLPTNHRGFIDLLSLGRETQSRFASVPSTQQCVLWGINLHGADEFCRPCNKLFSTPAGAPAVADVGALLDKERREQLWRIFANFQDTEDLSALSKLFDELFVNLPLRAGRDYTLETMLFSLARAFSTVAARSKDIFLPITAQSLICSQFLRLAPSSDDSFALSCLDELHSSMTQALEQVAEQLRIDEYALLSDEAGLADLFFLPLRISRILGAVALNKILMDALSSANYTCRAFAFDAHLAENLSRYLGSFVAVCEEQAPYLFLASCAIDASEMDSFLSLYMGCITNDFMNNKGRVAPFHVSGEDISHFLKARATGEYKTDRDVIARPSELASVLFYINACWGLDDVVDPYLRYLDHLDINFFVCDDDSTWACERVPIGRNVTLRLGNDAGYEFFNLSDFRDLFGTRVICQAFESCDVHRALLACATFSFGDRVPWQLSTTGLRRVSSPESAKA